MTLPKSLTCLGNFCNGGKIYHFSSEIIFGQHLRTLGDFFLVTLPTTHPASLSFFLCSDEYETAI